MATWLTYLRIAQKVKNRVDGIDLPYLMLGFVAPFFDKDQGDDLELEDIFKSLSNGRSAILEDSILSFKKKYIEPPFIIYKSDSKRSFLWGYYFNLIVRKLWIESFSKIEDAKNFLNAMDIYDYDFLLNNDYELIEEFHKSEIMISRCEDFNMLELIQLKNKIVKYYKNNRNLINSDHIKDFNSRKIEEFVIEAEKLCISNLLGKA